MQFSLRTGLIVVAFFSIGIAWMVDRVRIAGERDSIQRKLEIEIQRGLIAAESWEKRRQEVSSIANGKSPPDIPLLLFALSDPDRIVSQTALSALTELRFTRAELQTAFSSADAEAEMQFWIAAVKGAQKHNERRNDFLVERESSQPAFGTRLDDPFGPDPFSDADTDTNEQNDEP
ncbi:hypothetical protein FHS27_006531 [Rhodopirellula rubra]|uniref:HEAT repeat domain-containing protein n=1 Tax=Aporhodopirellula rubra TaxID=980271 RepID=A0A7W5H9L7_9BACT|nr:hypothetical protein RRSWK_06413 [Rhodopirellula sp. SWK7]MBB3210683.1 hypothetical protein [Aporhodopirellula rubra]